MYPGYDPNAKSKQSLPLGEHFYGAYKPGRSDKVGFKPY